MQIKIKRKHATYSQPKFTLLLLPLLREIPKQNENSSNKTGFLTQTAKQVCLFVCGTKFAPVLVVSNQIESMQMQTDSQHTVTFKVQTSWNLSLQRTTKPVSSWLTKTLGLDKSQIHRGPDETKARLLKSPRHLRSRQN